MTLVSSFECEAIARTTSTPELTLDPRRTHREGEDFDVVVIGAGQAGLAAGYYLSRSGLRFSMIDASASIGDSWRDRWDNLRLFTPARYNGLPGLPIRGPRYALPCKDEVAEYLDQYARKFRLPIHSSTSVTGLHRQHDRFVTVTSKGSMHAFAVIVATGANQRPYIPSFATQLDSSIVQLHSSRYRRPDQLPKGKCLVVGAGNSGAQIALDLAESRREVVLSGRETGWIPRRLLGRDIYDWLWPTLMRVSIESRLGRRLMKGRRFSGDPLVGIPSSAFESHGVRRVGRVISVAHGMPGLQEGVLRDVAVVVWCTGFRPDYSWIELPIFGLDGHPRHRRGLAVDVPGLGFLGMRFQHRMTSALLGGVGEDAKYLVGAIERARRTRQVCSRALET